MALPNGLWLSPNPAPRVRFQSSTSVHIDSNCVSGKPTEQISTLGLKTTDYETGQRASFEEVLDMDNGITIVDCENSPVGRCACRHLWNCVLQGCFRRVSPFWHSTWVPISEHRLLLFAGTTLRRLSVPPKSPVMLLSATAWSRLTHRMCLPLHHG